MQSLPFFTFHLKEFRQSILSYFSDVENYLEIEGNLKVVDFFFIKDRKKNPKQINNKS